MFMKKATGISGKIPRVDTIRKSEFNLKTFQQILTSSIKSSGDNQQINRLNTGVFLLLYIVKLNAQFYYRIYIMWLSLYA